MKGQGLLKEEKASHLLFYRIARNASAIAVAFLLLLGSLWLLEHRLSRKELPETELALESLREQLKDYPESPEMLQALRNLDYVYRRAYFDTQQRLNLGVRLGMAAVLVLLCGSVVMALSHPPELKKPSGQKDGRAVQLRRLRYGMALLIGAMLLLAGTVYFRKPAPQIPTESPAVEPAEEVPVLPTPAGLHQALALASENWPGFRGSILPNNNKLPANFRLQTIWQQKIELPGYNSPVIWGDRIFVSGGTSKARAIFCYALADGKLLWRAEAGQVAKLPEVTEDTGLAAPTLAVDSQLVCGIFATGQLLCLDHQGEVLWKKQLPFPEILYGYASSLLLAGPVLVVQYDLDEHQVLYGFDAISGRELWKTQRDSSVSWSSPVLLAEEDRFTVFTASNSKAEAFDLFTGRKLWENACMGGEVACSAFAAESLFYFANSGALSGAFSAVDGKLLWQNENVPLPDVASPVVAGGVMYLFSSGGTVIALDAASGEELYEENFDNGFYASPVVLEERIVAVNMDGLLLLIEPSREKWLQLATFELGRKIVATPAFAGGKIVFRTMNNELLCLEGSAND